MPLSAEELVNALHEAAAAKNVDNFVAVAGVLEDQVDETFVQQKKGQLRRVIKLYRQIQKEQDATPREILRTSAAMFAPSKGRSSASSSYRMTPIAQASAGSAYISELTTSGDM